MIRGILVAGLAACLAPGLVVAMGAMALAQPAPVAAPQQQAPWPLGGEHTGPGARAYERDVVEVAPEQPITLVDVDNRLGDLRIEGHDGQKLIISAYKHAPDDVALERLKVTLIPDPSGPVRISTAISTGREARPIRSGSVKIDLVIRAPRSARVSARVWNGRLEVVGMENGADLSSNDGRLDIKNASGTIVTHTARGEQHFVEIFGAVDAQAIAGNVALDIVRGQRLDASVHEGRIDGRSVRVREASLRTTRGDIRFQGVALAGGVYRIGSYSGNVEVKLGHTMPVTVRIRSRRGTVITSSGLKTQPDAQGGLIAALPGTTSARAAAAIVELRSHVGNIQFAVVQ